MNLSNVNQEADFDKAVHNLITHRFVVTDTPALVSPHGFSCDFPVCQKTKVFLQFEDKPTSTDFKHLDGPLFLHETAALGIDFEQGFDLPGDAS